MADEEVRLKLLAETRADLLKRQLSNAENYDKSVISLSTGFLGFSLLFLKDFILAKSAVSLWLLYASWGALTGALIATVVSFLVGQRAINTQLERAEDYYLNGNQAALERSRIAKIVDCVNFASGALFVLGVLFSVTFVFFNFERSLTMSNKAPSSQPLNESAPIPKMQTFERTAPIPNLQQVPQSAPAQSTPTTPPPAGNPSPDGDKK